jgi:ribonuclease III
LTLKSILLSFRVLFDSNKQVSRKIKKLTGFQPGNIKLYELAFTHRSASVVLENGRQVNNERLEFLGDAILGAVVTDYLFKEFPHYNEGDLTKLRSKIVNREFMNSLAQKIGIDTFIISQPKGMPQRKHIYGNTLEALIGSIFLDKGFRKTRKFISKKIIRPHVNTAWLISSNTDYKSMLIQWGQKNKQEISFENYELVDGEEKLPLFVASVKVMNLCVGEGTGLTKKEAQQHAAKHALENIAFNSVSSFIPFCLLLIIQSTFFILAKKVHKLEENTRADFQLIGISSYENDYRVCWDLNNCLKTDLQRIENFEVVDNKTKTSQEFPVFQFEDENKYIDYKFIGNRCENGFLSKNGKTLIISLKFQEKSPLRS